MMIIEVVCAAIIALFVIARGRGRMKQLGLLALSSIIAEDTVIRAYGFYAYSREWTIFIDQVPLLIALIWPIVILSAHDLAKHIPGPRAPITAAIVLFDAALIEPIAVRAQLWHWTEPGLFAVPEIGILGWAVFAFFAVERPLFAPLLTHGVLVALWWIFFRWVNVELPPWPCAIALWVLSAVLALRVRASIPRMELYLRVPAALFFFALLAIYGRDDPVLIVWSIAFAPPYLAQIIR